MLDAFVAVLIFVLGLPVFLLDFIVADDIRAVAHRRTSGFAIRAITAFVTLAFAAGVYFDYLAAPPTGRAGAAAHLLLCLCGIAVVGVWHVAGRAHSRIGLLHRLSRDLVYQFHSTGTVPEDVIQDIVMLGVGAAHKKERVAALEALRTAAQGVLIAISPLGRCRYTGDRLQALMRGIEQLGTGPVGHATDHLLPLSAEIVAELLASLSAAGLGDRSDAQCATRVLMRLSTGAATSGSDSDALICLEYVRTDPESLFRIGAAATDKRRYLLGLAALNRLEQLASQETEGGKPLLWLVGLLALLFYRVPGCRERIVLSLSSLILPDLNARISQIRACFYDMADFDTVSLIDNLTYNLLVPRPDSPSLSPQSPL